MRIARAWWRLVRPDDLLLLAVALWSSVFAVLVYLRHARFASADFDAGIFDQAVWLLARGDSFITVRGLDAFGHHASPAFYLLAPASWLGAGPHLLNVLQVLALAIGAVAVHHIARFHLQDSWLALGLALAYLLHPSVQWFAQELFHPEVVASAPLLLAYLAALHRRWRWCLGLAVLAIAWKEDVALAVAAMGLVLLARRQWRPGLVALVGGLGWFLFVTQVMLPAGSGGVFYARVFYGDFGTTTTEVAGTVLTEPGRVVARLREAGALTYLRELVQPYGFVPLLAPLALLPGAPQALFNLISVQNFTWETELHYAALPLVAVTVALVEGVARVRSLAARRVLVAIVLVSAAAATVTSGTSPLSRDFDRGMWPLQPDARQAVLEEAVTTPPRDAAVSASYRLVPHLTHRERIYSFPNPWVPVNWGHPGDPAPGSAVVQWLVVDRTSLNLADRELLDRLLRSGEFAVVSEEQDVVIARRR